MLTGDAGVPPDRGGYQESVAPNSHSPLPARWRRHASCSNSQISSAASAKAFLRNYPCLCALDVCGSLEVGQVKRCVADPVSLLIKCHLKVERINGIVKQEKEQMILLKTRLLGSQQHIRVR